MAYLALRLGARRGEWSNFRAAEEPVKDADDLLLVHRHAGGGVAVGVRLLRRARRRRGSARRAPSDTRATKSDGGIISYVVM